MLPCHDRHHASQKYFWEENLEMLDSSLRLRLDKQSDILLLMIN